MNEDFNDESENNESMSEHIRDLMTYFEIKGFNEEYAVNLMEVSISILKGDEDET